MDYDKNYVEALFKQVIKLREDLENLKKENADLKHVIKELETHLYYILPEMDDSTLH